MDENLASFLIPLTPFAEQTVTWPHVTLRLVCYLTEIEPPLEYVTSARAIVIDRDKVLVVQDSNNLHIMPGGRLEPDETPEIALRREVLEETGWSLACLRPIGIMHFAHIDPMPEGWSYPYPDFLQIMYAGCAGEYHSELKEEGSYELDSGLVPVAEVQDLPLDSGQQVFLNAALQSLRGIV